MDQNIPNGFYLTLVISWPILYEDGLYGELLRFPRPEVGTAVPELPSLTKASPYDTKYTLSYGVSAGS